MTDTEPALRVRQLLDAQVQCALATQGEDAPALHLMAYAVSNDLSEVYVVSREGTAKVGNMRSRAPVALLWDNRTGLLADHVRGTVLTARADARELSGATREAAAAALAARNPSLSGLLAAPDTTVFALSVHHYGIGTGYGDHTHYAPGSGAS